MAAHGDQTTSDVIELEDESPELISACMKSFDALMIETDDEFEGDDKSSESCVICLKSFTIGGDAVITNCDHIFHKDCIKRWAAKNIACPLCHVAVFTLALVYVS